MGFICGLVFGVGVSIVSINVYKPEPNMAWYGGVLCIISLALLVMDKAD